MSFGTRHIDESVFAFILAGNLQTFFESRIKQFIHHLYGYLVHSASVLIRVWGIVCLIQGFAEPPADKRSCLTLSFVNSRPRGMGGRIQVTMAKVIDPKEKIKDYLISQGYLPLNPNNTSDALHNAIITGASYFHNEYVDEDFSAVGYCWASNVTKTDTMLDVVCEAISALEDELSCYNQTGKSLVTLVVEQCRSLSNATD